MNRRDPAISKGIDWSLFWIYLILVIVGLVAIFGATYKEGDPVLQTFINFKTDYSKQLYFFAVALLLGLFYQRVSSFPLLPLSGTRPVYSCY